jgi:hypothetical protein
LEVFGSPTVDQWPKETLFFGWGKSPSCKLVYKAH